MNGDDAFIDHWFHCAPGPLKELKATNESITTRLQTLQDKVAALENFEENVHESLGALESKVSSNAAYCRSMFEKDTPPEDKTCRTCRNLYKDKGLDLCKIIVDGGWCIGNDKHEPSSDLRDLIGIIDDDEPSISIYEAQIEQLKEQLTTLKETDDALLGDLREQLAKYEERLGSNIGLIEQIDELEAKLELVEYEHEEMDKAWITLSNRYLHEEPTEGLDLAKENAELKALLDTTRENAQSQIFELKKMLSEVVDDE